MKKQTAVEWFWNQIENSKPNLNWYKILEQAKEMENERAQEYAEFAIRCDREGMKILNFDGFIKLEK